MRKQHGGNKAWPLNNFGRWFAEVISNSPVRWTHSLHKVSLRMGIPTSLSPAHITILSALVTELSCRYACRPIVTSFFVAWVLHSLETSRHILVTAQVPYSPILGPEC